MEKESQNIELEENYIEFKNVSKTYNGIKALDNLSFKIKKGDIFGYIGPNGAGKTTTIKILVGLIRNFKGQVFLKGKDISNRRGEFYKILGYLTQEVGFQEWRTVNHALMTFGKLSGLDSVYLKSRIKELLELFSLTDFRYKKIVHLSGGMKQKLQFAQAMLHKPEILVLDEPMTGLDPTSRYQIKEIIKNLSKTGITIFLSSHILSDVQDFSTQIGILNKGKLMKSGSPLELQRDFNLTHNVELEYAENSPPCLELENIHCIKSVEITSANKQIIIFENEADIDQCIHTILEKVLEQNCRIRNLNIKKPNLEEVYLKYVGGGK